MLSRNENEENLSIRSLNFLKVHHRTPFFLFLLLSWDGFECLLKGEGLSFVKKLAIFGISITQLVDECKSCILIDYATSGLIVIVIE